MLLLRSEVGPGLRRSIGRQRRSELAERQLRIGDHREGTMLSRVETRDVDRNDARVAGEGGPRTRREVLQTRADRKNEVRASGHGVGRV